MSKKKKDFRTHIPEPRWQQIVSVIIVAVFFVIWLLFVLKVI